MNLGPSRDRGVVALRGVTRDDIETFYEHQADSEATDMAAFPSRELEPHTAHWEKITTDPSVIAKTILFDDRVAGNVVSWEAGGRREVGYWIGREFWGRGVATMALSLFLEIDLVRPLYAHVANHNVGSRRVLEKCGFAMVSDGIVVEDVEESVLILKR